MEKLSLKVKGMHCHSCEMLIKESLTDAGVKVADVSFKEGTVNVLFEETKIKASQIKKLIEKEGYKVI